MTLMVSEIEDACKAVKEQRKIVDEYKSILRREQELLDKYEHKVLAMLEESGKTSYDSNVGKFYTSEHWSWKIPRTPEARELYFNWLKKRGNFDDMIGVNSQTMNSDLRAEQKLAQERGEIFMPPGLDLPNVEIRLGFRSN